MKNTLYRLEREINSLDACRMCIRVKNTFMDNEINSLLKERTSVQEMKRFIE